MPAALFGYCRVKGFGPLSIVDGAVFPNDRQTQFPLLCESCEDVLNRGGESWLLPKLVTYDRKFPLYDLLTKCPTLFSEEDLAVYSTAANPEVKTEMLEHFALGLFWKASVHSWRGQTMLPSIELGPYSESIRRFLLNESGFPENVCLAVSISTQPHAQIMIVAPYEGKRQTCRGHITQVPGVFFLMSLGKEMPEAAEGLCIHRSPHKPITVSEHLSNVVQDSFDRVFQDARKTLAFLEYETRMDRARADERNI